VIIMMLSGIPLL